MGGLGFLIDPVTNDVHGERQQYYFRDTKHSTAAPTSQATTNTTVVNDTAFHLLRVRLNKKVNIRPKTKICRIYTETDTCLWESIKYLFKVIVDSGKCCV
jgi:hypothetical protein